MLIRTEAPSDILAIDHLLREVSLDSVVADRVMKLRENGQRTLAIVACDDSGEVIGFVMFSPVTLNGEEVNWQALSSLYLNPSHRQRGIAKQMVEEGLTSLSELGYPACVVIGDNKYFSYFGFKNNELLCHLSKLPDPLLIIELEENACSNRQGVIQYGAEFSDS